MAVRLDPITVDNWRDAIQLDVAEEQRRFLDSESILHFLAEARFYPSYEPHAIYDGETMVGFVSYGYIPEDSRRWWIPLLIIDRRHQHRGYGRAALEAVIEDVCQRAPDCESLGLSYHPENIVAERLYRSLGFEPTGKVDERGEVYVELRLPTDGSAFRRLLRRASAWWRGVQWRWRARR